MRDKRADYFAAGTKVVWEVDLVGDKVIRSFTSGDEYTVFSIGEMADAESVLPGWKFEIDALFF